jgi:hypothetical protein
MLKWEIYKNVHHFKLSSIRELNGDNNLWPHQLLWIDSKQWCQKFNGVFNSCMLANYEKSLKIPKG